MRSDWRMQQQLNHSRYDCLVAPIQRLHFSPDCTTTKMHQTPRVHLLSQPSNTTNTITIFITITNTHRNQCDRPTLYIRQEPLKLPAQT